MQISFFTAFLGGALALLSPCSALLLPAFFAATVGTRLRLLAHGAVFYIGLVLTLVPFGMGIGALGALLVQHRGLIILITSVVLVALGIALALGIGFDLSKALPGADTLQRRAQNRTGWLRTLLLGAASGVAGFCAGPILGAVLTLALGQGSAWTAGIMLAFYAAGMVVPLMIIAAAWQRLGDRGRRLLRGRTITIAGRDLHTTSLITGALIVAVGVLFWLTNGLVSLPSPVPDDVTTWFQTRAGHLAGPIFDVALIAAAAVVILTLWWRRERSRGNATDDSTM
ncbi:cytochrome c biogenesis CcdA family protein [Propioniferax innocua]|uniref:cytochrome c biogenesis CcdA family protein n=1 Tax=Propioniferax innocua TaxID=1753 RepID=UPI0031DFF463